MFKLDLSEKDRLKDLYKGRKAKKLWLKGQGRNTFVYVGEIEDAFLKLDAMRNKLTNLIQKQKEELKQNGREKEKCI